MDIYYELFSVFCTFKFDNCRKIYPLPKYNGKKKKSQERYCLSSRSKLTVWTSLVAQWLRLCAPNAGDLSLIPGQQTRLHLPKPRPGVVKKKKKKKKKEN